MDPSGNNVNRALQVHLGARKCLALSAAAMMALACGFAHATASPTPNMKVISDAFDAEISSIMQVTFYCSRAADSDSQLAATAGPYVTHSESTAECKKQLQLADSNVQRNKKALTEMNWISSQATKAQQVLADLARVSQLIADANTAVGVDDRSRLKMATSTLGDAEGQVEFDEFELMCAISNRNALNC